MTSRSFPLPGLCLDSQEVSTKPARNGKCSYLEFSLLPLELTVVRIRRKYATIKQITLTCLNPIFIPATKFFVMNTKMLAAIKALLLPVIFAGASFAQEETSLKELPAVAITSSTNVSAKVNKAFSQYFKGASHLRWYQLEQKLLVKFIQNDQENRALFTKNGQLVYHISYGEEQHLPVEIRNLIKGTYYDQKITRVLKVNQDKREIWVVSMEDAKDFIMARVEEMELEETQRMAKSIAKAK